jgi:vacuolar-type H+-ATPase subunit E/Vma4
MGESGIARRILDAARRSGEEALAAERARQAGALRQGAALIEEEVAARRAAAEKRLREAHQQEISAFRLAEANRVRSERRTSLDGVVAGAWQKALAPATYRAWVGRLLSEHGRPGDEIVVASGQRALFEGELAPLLARHGVKLADERGAFQAGFVIVRPGSVTRLNCTLDKAFAEAVRSTEIEVARTLFSS